MVLKLVTCRGDIPHSKNKQVLAWIKKIFPSKYAYCKEFKKTNNKQHFHIMGDTKFHVDTVRRKFKLEFNLNLKGGSDKYVMPVQDKIKKLNYIMKDGEYFLYNITDDELEEREIYNDGLQLEMSLKTLKEKCLHYLNNYENASVELNLNSDIMMCILKWFQDKKLKYPSQWWLKSTMIQYVMDRKADVDFPKLLNLQKLYNVNDPFLNTNSKTI